MSFTQTVFHPLIHSTPQKYFPYHLKTSQAAAKQETTLQRAEKARKILLQEYFSSTSRVPELEGWLHFKDGYKKGWKKYFFILRASGLYYSKAGKQKVWDWSGLYCCAFKRCVTNGLESVVWLLIQDFPSFPPPQSAKHLVLLVQFDDYELYHGINFKKTLKAPTPFCFCLRVSPPPIAEVGQLFTCSLSLQPIPRQFVPGPKDMKVLCADEESLALSWTAGNLTSCEVSSGSGLTCVSPVQASALPSMASRSGTTTTRPK